MGAWRKWIAKQDPCSLALLTDMHTNPHAHVLIAIAPYRLHATRGSRYATQSLGHDAFTDRPVGLVGDDAVDGEDGGGGGAI
ncbi:hypothetical protein Aduo_010651 [Ancylostoma duodenale]